MTENQTVELNSEQVEVLLRGLRYVRSSILLDPHIPSPEDTAKRERQLDEIAALVDTLSGNPQGHATAGAV